MHQHTEARSYLP